MNMRQPYHLFLAGVPATGKSWLGQWLAEQHGYLHIDAERDRGADFDRAGVHEDWQDLLATGRARRFLAAINELHRPVIVNWGFPTRFLYVVVGLQAEGVHTWWFKAETEAARRAFVERGGIDPVLFDRQMADINREWLLIKFVFGPRIVEALRHDGTQRRPEELWSEISAREQTASPDRPRD
jgi:hypothetical protein